MNHDINVKKMRLNCFRQSKVPGEFMLQMRVPGGMVDAKYHRQHLGRRQLPLRHPPDLRHHRHQV